jgi:hypothetical protein
VKSNFEQPVPTRQQLLKSVGIALATAAVILVVVVLPAEYGIDPMGSGTLLGVTRLNAESREVEIAPGQAAAGTEATLAPVIQQQNDFLAETLSVTLDAFEGTEVKALMAAGEQFTFSWSADGKVVYSDMHGEAAGAADDEFTTYWKEKQQAGGRGVFTAPFAGTHGWYWQNMSEEPVVIQVSVSGFFRKLYIP